MAWQNGSTLDIDLNVEKIPVSFSMSEDGIITMTNADGTTYTADIGSLIKTYNFVDSDQIDFTATLQEDGSYSVTGTIKGGSITDAMLESGYLASVTAQASSASTSSQNATAKATLAESYAKGGTNTRTGEDTDNAKYYSDRASTLVDVDIATTSKAGIVKPDGTTITVDTNGLINAPGGHTHSNKATLDSITETDLTNWNAKADMEDIPVIATTSVPGTVKPDGTTITVDANGVITATAQAPDIATPLVAGIVKFDDETIGMDENDALYVIGGGDASGVAYSNTESGLSAENVQDAIDEVNNSLVVNGEVFYYDVQNGVRGYNTSPTRGADTFTPFSSSREMGACYSWVGMGYRSMVIKEDKTIISGNPAVGVYASAGDYIYITGNSKNVTMKALQTGKYLYGFSSENTMHEVDATANQILVNHTTSGDEVFICMAM